MNKRASQRKHAKRRALERHGIVVGERTLDDMVRKIQRGQAEFVERQSLRVTIWRVDGRKVVYDKLRKTIVTFLPEPGAMSVWDRLKELP